MKKGFTLVELLAVIVILAAIVLILRPVLINLIKEVKEDLSLISAKTYFDIVDDAITTYVFNNGNIESGTYEIMDTGNICLGVFYNGSCLGEELVIDTGKAKPTDGSLVYEDGDIKQISFLYNEIIFYKNSLGEIAISVVQNPSLDNKVLRPVIYNGSEWVIADPDKSMWYDYSNQEWANAVILKSGISKKIGDRVTVDGTNPEVLAMFVWIPRYEYKIEGEFGKGGISASEPGEIEVNFITLDQEEPSEGYIIHPAFISNDKPLSGIWVGKFETSNTQYSNYNFGCSDKNCSSADYIRVLPNVIATSSNSLSNFFYAIKSMTRNGNTFGLDSKSADTHVMKNSEWGAVAYLSQSSYGKYGNSAYSGLTKAIYKNNSSDYYTGKSGGSYKTKSTAKGSYTYDDLLEKNIRIGLENDLNNPWTENGNQYNSTNYGDSSNSNLSISFRLDNKKTLSFEWCVSSESDYDFAYYTIKKDDVQMTATGISTKISGTEAGTSESSLIYSSVSAVLEPGYYELIFTYEKDGSVSDGLDAAYVRDVKLDGEDIFDGVDLIETIINIKNGVGASTTGNITGVYDMNGGAFEYTMGLYSNSSGSIWTGNQSSNSGFKGYLGTSESYYDGYELTNADYDVYKAASSGTINFDKACSNNTCYGHATTEVKNWYDGAFTIIDKENPWIVRGSSANDSDSSIFSLTSSSGGAKKGYTVRVVLIEQ